jgi:ATP-dependent protease HslVU (ClpYQ) peptidase subunit
MFVALLAVTCEGTALAQTAAPPEPHVTPDAVTAVQLYARSVAAMRALETPSFVTFASAWNSAGMRFDIYRDDDRIVLAIGSGRNFSDRHDYAVAYRRADRMLALTEGSADRFVGGSHFLDPTWAGAYDLLRYGFRGAPPSGATPQPAATATASSAAIPTIGTVTAISAAFYRVEDEGAGSCPSGAAGEVLKLTALRDPRMHPLTAVTIDAANDRFCSMRFNVNESGVYGITGNYEVHFAESAGYWLVSGGTFDLAVRVLGISAKHVALQWNNSDFATPADISATQFQTPAPAPRT